MVTDLSDAPRICRSERRQTLRSCGMIAAGHQAVCDILSQFTEPLTVDKALKPQFQHQQSPYLMRMVKLGGLVLVDIAANNIGVCDPAI